MRRSEFLQVTGLSRDVFNKLLRDGMIPHAKNEGWGDYSARSALLTCVSLGLAKASPSQALASRFVQAEADLIFDKFKDLNTLQSADCWIGYVRVQGRELDPETNNVVTASYKHPLCGSLGEVFQAVAGLKVISAKGQCPTDLVLVDVSQHLRDMIERADMAGAGSAFRDLLSKRSDA